VYGAMTFCKEGRHAWTRLEIIACSCGNLVGSLVYLTMSPPTRVVWEVGTRTGCFGGGGDDVCWLNRIFEPRGTVPAKVLYRKVPEYCTTNAPSLTVHHRWTTERLLKRDTSGTKDWGKRARRNIHYHGHIID